MRLALRSARRRHTVGVGSVLLVLVLSSLASPARADDESRAEACSHLGDIIEIVGAEEASWEMLRLAERHRCGPSDHPIFAELDLTIISVRAACGALVVTLDPPRGESAMSQCVREITQLRGDCVLYDRFLTCLATVESEREVGGCYQYCYPIQ